MSDSGTKYILVTGAAGFIGFHLCQRLLSDGHSVIGLDSLNDYYDVTLKHSRLNQLKQSVGFTFVHENLTNQSAIEELFSKHKISHVVNLAAQAGVRYSLINPQAYIESNITGFLNLIDSARRNKVEHFLFASSSSVYGANTQLPFSEKHNVDHPVSLYAATKKSNELMAHSYAVNFGMPVTGLRFFTVYGPWGRPDMALFLFAKAIINDQPIDVYNNGDMIRDFTYVGDVVESVTRLIHQPAAPIANWKSEESNPSSSFAPYRVYNVGNHSPVNLMDFIRAIEKTLGKQAKINYLPIQMGDVPKTYADTSLLENAIDYKPSTTIQQGIDKFIGWYKEYYK